MMKTLAAGCTSAAILLSASGAHAAGAPPQLYNKTISLSFSATVNATAEDGSTASRPRQIQRTIYISSKGRVFSRSDRQAGRNSDVVERDPGSTRGAFRFEGNRLIGSISDSSAAQARQSFPSIPASKAAAPA